MNELQTFSSDQKMFDQLFEQLPKYYYLLKETQFDLSQIHVFQLIDGVYFTINEQAFDTSLILFKTKQFVQYATNSLVSPVQVNDSIPFIPITPHNLETLIYQSLIVNITPLNVYQIFKQKIMKTYAGTPGNLQGLTELCPQLLLVQTYNAFIFTQNKHSDNGETEISIIFVRDYEIVTIIIQDNVKNYQNLVSTLYQIQVNEIIVPQHQLTEDLALALENANITYSKIYIHQYTSQHFLINHENVTTIMQQLEQLTKIFDKQDKASNKNSITPQILLTIIMQRLVSLVERDQYIEKAKVTQIDCLNYMRVSQQDLEQLGFDQIISFFKQKLCTDSGKRMISQYMSRPLKDLQEIKKRQQFTQSIKTNKQLIQTIKLLDGFSISALQLLNVSSDKYQLATRATLNIYRFTKNAVKNLVEQITENQYLIDVKFNDDSHGILPQFQLLIEQTNENLDTFNTIIEKYIVTMDSLFPLFNTCVLVNPNLSEDLKPLFQKLLNIYDQILQTQKDMSDKLDITTEAHCKVYSTANNKLYFKFPILYLQKIQELEKFKHGKIQEKKQTGIKFQSFKLDDLASSFLEIYTEYLELSKQYIIEMLQHLKPYGSMLRAIMDAIGCADIANSFVEVQKLYNLQYPTVQAEDSDIKEQIYEDTCNPALLFQSSFTQKNSFIIDDKIMIITGPNSGGKTQLLKAIANNQIFAQLGAPCVGNLSVKIRDQLCLRFGSGDDLASGMSTFMFEMTQLSCILQTATCNSLVLIDELGRGTSVEDGFGLSVAVIEYFMERKINCVLVTHLFSVVEFLLTDKERQKHINLRRVTSELKNDDLVMTYQLEEGIDTSHGIQVARNCGIPASVISSAQEWEQVRKSDEDIWSISKACLYVGNEDGENNWDLLLVQYQMGLITKEQLRETIGY